VERGGSLTLTCKHNIAPDKLDKVRWLKGGNKVFEYIKGRQPPFLNFSTPGAEVDVSWWSLLIQMAHYANMCMYVFLQFRKSNQNQLTIKILDFDASGMYCCEVSLESPIFTKASNEEQVHVFRKCIDIWYLRRTFYFIRFYSIFSYAVPQNLPPIISFSKSQFYVGEKLIANCTTARAKPGESSKLYSN
jgi:hypothetical protein